MSSKLDKKELKKKKKHHKTRMEFYGKKLEEAEKEESRIGFKW